MAGSWFGGLLIRKELERDFKGAGRGPRGMSSLEEVGLVIQLLNQSRIHSSLASLLCGRARKSSSVSHPSKHSPSKTTSSNKHRSGKMAGWDNQRCRVLKAVGLHLSHYMHKTGCCLPSTTYTCLCPLPLAQQLLRIVSSLFTWEKIIGQI